MSSLVRYNQKLCMEGRRAYPYGAVKMKPKQVSNETQGGYALWHMIA